MIEPTARFCELCGSWPATDDVRQSQEEVALCSSCADFILDQMDLGQNLREAMQEAVQ